MSSRVGAGVVPGGFPGSVLYVLLLCAGCAGGGTVQSGNPGAAGSVAGQTVELETMIVPYPLGQWETDTDEDAQTVRFAQRNQTNPGAPAGSNESVVIGAMSDASHPWTEEEASYVEALARIETQLDVLPTPLPPGTGFDSTNFDQVTVHDRVYGQFDYSRQVPVDAAGTLGEEVGRLYVYVPPESSSSPVFYLLISKLQAFDAEDTSMDEIEVVLDGFVPLP